MWFPVSTVAAVCLLLDILADTAAENDLEVIFRQRSHSDWQDAWHKEKFSRCRETLVRHLYWACEKDIYRLTRRSDPTFTHYPNNIEEATFPWLAPKKAKKMLRYRRNAFRRAGSSITNECCKSTGCTWEEYAEYCPTNKRYTTYV